MPTRGRAWLLSLCIGLAVCAGVVWTKSRSPLEAFPLRVTARPQQLRADGYDTAILSIENGNSEPPSISLSGNAYDAAIEQIGGSAGKWWARIRAGVVPGRIGLEIESPGRPAATFELTAVLDDRDSAGDGTPDFLRLDSGHDRQAFRRWFAYLAEAEYFRPPHQRPPEINDCAALIRYAYREALRAHDTAWANSSQLTVIPAFDSVGKYRYPSTPLGASLFRVKPQSFRANDLTGGAFLQFADARSLWRFNTHSVSRDLDRALPGDLLFFRQESDHTTFHGMIYLGKSHVQPDGRRYVVYHTGPTGSDPGEIRRLTVEELKRFPQAGWRPMAANPSFLGVARWNILRGETNEPQAWRQ